LNKILVDSTGNTITLAADQDDQVLGVEIYQKAGSSAGYDEIGNAGEVVSENALAALQSGYTKIHDKEIKVSSGSYMGVSYDYDVTRGNLYYIAEKADTIPESIVDNKGNTLYYQGSYIQTEYVWRNMSTGEVYGRHSVDSDNYLTSVPEVVGDYTVEGHGHQDWSDPTSDTYYNRFLDFYIYNVYDSESFYVYHSSDKSIEKISMRDVRIDRNGKFNIAAETKDGFLYGGYYKAFKSAGVTDAQINGTAESGNLEYTADTNHRYWATDTAGTAYDASKANIWVKADAYDKNNGDEIGTAMTPEANHVYYLKEVPNGYIRPYNHYTYDNYDPQKTLKKLYVFTATDDKNYASAGYIISPSTTQTDADTTSLVVSVKKPNGKIDATLTVKSIWASRAYPDGSVTLGRGYIWWSDITNYLGTGITYRPCWTTLDGVLVKGLTQRTIDNGTKFGQIGAKDTNPTD